MKPESISKYRPFPAVALPDRQWPDRTITQTPQWCSVDLRDGNQALAIPMGVDEKVEMFNMLVEIGFKEIEVGFPSASDTEFAFLRRLVDDDLIPNDVTLQVLVQTREHLIKRTFESLQGVPRAIVHIYNSTSPLQRRITFRDASKEDIKEIAVSGARVVRQLVPTLPDTNIRLQYSPESFSDTEIDYALEVCEAVMDVWQPTAEAPIILNLPATVEWATPNVHADQIEWFCRHMKERDKALISLHTHNDRGTGVAATELGLLAGADRVEGTLFGNGERTGNLDIVTVALNMNTHGIATGLDFSNLDDIRVCYERVTKLRVPERWPYGGELVFTAFSGSHQDAIKKGMDLRDDASPDQAWEVPYLTIDPRDLGRSYEAIIRINSQSGKGGIAYVLDRDHGFDLPKTMHPEVGMTINQFADSKGQELTSPEIADLFRERFVNLSAPLEILTYELDHSAGADGNVVCTGKIALAGKQFDIEGEGNGPINAFTAALDKIGQKDFHLIDYRSHAIGTGSATDSASYVCIRLDETGRSNWGCGRDASIEMAGVRALVAAYNRSRV